MNKLLKGAATLVAIALAPGSFAATTGSTGGGQPFDNLQPSLAVTQAFVTVGAFPGRGDPNTAATGDTLGFVYNFAGDFLPGTSRAADGQLLPINTNTALFSVFDTSYGGNGIQNFALPDLRGTAQVGAGAGPGLAVQTIGQRTGDATVTLTVDQLPAHDHSLPAGGMTDPTGGGATFSNLQPSLPMRSLIAVNAEFPNTFGAASMFLGQIAAFAGDYTPNGWADADGAVLDIVTHVDLFNLIGTTYGGDGVTNFALPDLRGRLAVGVDAAHSLGAAFGTDLTSVSLAQMPAHDHTLPVDSTGVTGGSQPLGNVQPSLALNYLIATQGAFPVQSTGTGFLADNSILGQIVSFAGDFAPRGWTVADGRLLPIGPNAALFSVFGTTYGGDGITTFALPDLRGRTLIGVSLVDGIHIGDVLGKETNLLTVANLAAHTHTFDVVTPPPPEVPAPAALPLLAMACAGLLAMRRYNGPSQRAAESGPTAASGGGSV